VGQKYVNISNYAPGAADVLKDNEYIIGVNPMGYTKILEIAGEALKALLPGSGDETLARIKNTFASTSELVSGLNNLVKANEKEVKLSIEQLYQTLKEIGNAAGSLNALIADNQAQLTAGIGSIGKTLAEFEKTITSLESMMKRIEAVASALDSKKVDSIMVQLESASKEIAKATNAINKVVADKDGVVTWMNSPEVRFELTNILHNLSLFSKKIKDDPSLIMWKK
jgi:methyl-accepting chemotaxis protein